MLRAFDRLTLTSIHEKLARINSSGRVIPPEHPWQSHIARDGHYGVQLFFVISGFILALPFASYHLIRSRAGWLEALQAFFALNERPCMRRDWPVGVWQKVKPFVSVPG